MKDHFYRVRTYQNINKSTFFSFSIFQNIYVNKLLTHIFIFYNYKTIIKKIKATNGRPYNVKKFIINTLVITHRIQNSSCFLKVFILSIKFTSNAYLTYSFITCALALSSKSSSRGSRVQEPYLFLTAKEMSKSAS